MTDNNVELSYYCVTILKFSNGAKAKKGMMYQLR